MLITPDDLAWRATPRRATAVAGGVGAGVVAVRDGSIRRHQNRPHPGPGRPTPARTPHHVPSGRTAATESRRPRPGPGFHTIADAEKPAEPTKPAQGSHWGRSVGLLAVATIAIGMANYLVSIAGVHLLSATQFSDFAAGQGLLLVLGTGSFAALPWAVARYLARSTNPQAPNKAMHFGVVGSALQALVLGPVAFGVCWSLDGLTFGIAGALAAVMISLLAGPIGFLQGREDMGGIAFVRLLETGVRIAATMAIIFAFSRDAGLVLLAFPIGSVVALAYALRRGRAGFPMQRLGRGHALALTRDASLLGGIQVLLAMLGALDTVYAAGASFSADQAASYQSAALLARIPLFFSAAISTAAYTGMAAAGSEEEAGRQLRGAIRTYCWLAVPFLVAYLTLPQRLLDIAIPAKYADTLPTLRILCVAGVLIGLVNVITTGHQARGRFRNCIAILVAAVVVQAGALIGIGHTGHLLTFTAAMTVVCVVTVALLGVDAWAWLRVTRIEIELSARLAPTVLLVVAAVAAVFVHNPLAWIGLLLLVGVGAVATAFNHSPTSRSAHLPSANVTPSVRLTPIEEPTS